MIEILKNFVDFVLHIDVHLGQILCDYRSWFYLILFLIIFCETGLVVTPFLPGDSLLFASGSIAAQGVINCPDAGINIFFLVLIVLLAAFLGDNSNYFFGRFLGHKIYEKNYKLIRREYIDKTHAFYEKHGGKTVVIARFFPIIRTFAPFVAGAGTMKYFRFISFSILGTATWVIVFTSAGYFLGQTPFVQKHFTSIVLALILIPALPSVYALIKQVMNKRKAKK
jgi:membrane-associated protein